MQKWAYLVFNFKDDALVDIQLRLEGLGNEGWELVAFDWQVRMAILKRPKS